MTESTAGPAGTPKTRAHERLSTGTWARWARFCATHPWRVVIGWVGIIAVLIGLVATVGGSLRDEFEIPGSDTQRATDLRCRFGRTVDERDVGSEDAAQQWLEELVVRAAKHEHVDVRGHERRQILRRDLPCHRVVHPALFDQRNE